ncbi:3-hydroxyanthranilate 3,4-dioxygenase [Suhomyces tanzawaensis NRRL Y-17324]|uniref:3-hydroxyanthranilate 3,4-dioxygenase n=1 Tax=Suhomyces tanzawaensis NRRL Y-17324 TaxID=984487 RepID=A0A1E4SKN0_9ASCO|nr:3-hydroxyanthranilate 3,4-dioxygenase [Suhomyces tanzawaensis NRRL Y-17324]ODV80075.1 3-hydroxyanthranilate 3,4-dioxygenase [Suhomyces tanzawaensis NRRL Y-17324]
MLPQPINIQKWIKENGHLLQPPVNNYCLHRGGFTVMIVGGPNERTDYHVNQTPEYFHMFKGSMCLKVVDDGEFRDIIIEEGDSFLLPGNTPHNPVRFADTIGLVVEQDRPEGVNDKLRWYCLNCQQIVHEVEFYCVDLGTQVKEGILAFDGDIEARTCGHCGTLNHSKPQ